LQDANVLADELKAQVLMPDFFEDDEPWSLEKFPRKTDEDKKKLQEWFGGYADPANHWPKFNKVGQTLRHDGADFVTGYGYCWGGKVVINGGIQSDTPFGAVSIIHPA
jgi:dienelactone hydrolase